MTRIWRGLRRRIDPSFKSLYTGRLIRPDFARKVGLKEHARALQERKLPYPLTERAFHYNNLTWGILPFFLEVLDRAAGAHQIEPRYPFFDRHLVEFCLSLPAEQKMSGGYTRRIMRQALEGILPEEIRWRGGKTDLSHNFNAKFLEYERPLIEEILREAPGGLDRYVNLEVARAAYQRYREGRTNDGEAITVWKAVSLALWLQRFGGD
jgi:asparagine synthase (glutamine-hydrolysing)